MLKAIHDLFNNKTLRRIMVKARVLLALLACAGLATQMKPEWYWIGAAVALLGAFLQWWCFACLKKQKIIARNGLYGFVRNPMYLARFILLLGAFIMTANPWLIAALVVFYYFYMVNRVAREEVTLAGIFGDDYQVYCREVPRFLPRWQPHPGGSPFYWSWELFQRNNGWRNAAGVLGMMAALWWYLFKVQAG